MVRRILGPSPGNPDERDTVGMMKKWRVIIRDLKHLSKGFGRGVRFLIEDQPPMLSLSLLSAGMPVAHAGKEAAYHAIVSNTGEQEADITFVMDVYDASRRLVAHGTKRMSVCAGSSLEFDIVSGWSDSLRVVLNGRAESADEFRTHGVSPGRYVMRGSIRDGMGAVLEELSIVQEMVE